MKKSKQFLTSETGYVFLWLLCSALGVALQMLICRWYSLNYDSSYQIALTEKSLPELWKLLQADYSPPLYAILLKLTSMLFGESITVYRLFNGAVLSGMLYLGLFPIRREFGHTAGLLYTALALFTNINLYIFSTIRPTYLAYFLVSGLAVYTYLAFFKQERKHIVWFTVFAVLCVYTHNIAMIAALGIYIVCLTGAVIQKNRKLFFTFLISGIICAVLYLPWLFVLLQQVRNVSEHFWEGESFSIPLVQSWVYNKITIFSDINIVTILIDLLPRIAIVLILLRYFKIDRKGDMTKLKASLRTGWAQCRPYVIRYGFITAQLIVPLLIFAVINECFHKLATQRYFYLFTGITLLLMVLPIAKAKNKIISIVFALLCAVNFSGPYISLLQRANNIEGKQMIADIQSAHPDGNMSFVHYHEWSIGIMMYFFPDASHYLCSDTFTVLTDMSVFPSEVIDIGDIQNITEYTDTFYTVDIALPGCEPFDPSVFGDRISTIHSREYDFGIVVYDPLSFVLDEHRLTCESKNELR